MFTHPTAMKLFSFACVPKLYQIPKYSRTHELTLCILYTTHYKVCQEDFLSLYIKPAAGNICRVTSSAKNFRIFFSDLIAIAINGVIKYHESKLPPIFFTFIALSWYDLR